MGVSRVCWEVCIMWGDAFVMVKNMGIPVRPWMETFMSHEEMTHYWDNYPLQYRGPRYHVSLCQDVTGESPDYSDSVLDWAGKVYAYWIQLLRVEPTYVYKKAPIDLLNELWFEYHSIMNWNAVIWNLEHETWRPDAPFLKPEEGDFPYADLEEAP